VAESFKFTSPYASCLTEQSFETSGRVLYDSTRFKNQGVPGLACCFAEGKIAARGELLRKSTHSFDHCTARKQIGSCARLLFSYPTALLKEKFAIELVVDGRP
jgi:hypothetical protein